MPAPRPRPLENEWELEIESLLLWNNDLRPDADTLDLQAALSSCNHVLARMGLKSEDLERRLRALLPTSDSGRDDDDRYLFAARALLGLIDPMPTNQSALPGANGVCLGDVELDTKKRVNYRADTVALRQYGFAWSVLARKAYVHRLFGLSGVSGIKRGSRATRLMVRALGNLLDLAVGDPGQHRGRPGSMPISELSSQLARRLNEPVAGYPAHLTPDKLVGSLTLSSIDPHRNDLYSEGAHHLYVSARTFGGVPASDEVARQRRLIVLGNPGGGKSTVLSASVAGAARRGEPALFVRLASISAAERTARTVEEAVTLLIEAQSDDLGIALSEDVQALVKSFVSDPTALLALDGLDEVQASHIERIHNLLRLLSNLPGRIVVSSRLAGYTTPPGEWREVMVDALAPNDVDQFITSWFEGNGVGAKRARAALEHQAGRALAETPVLLGIIATVAEEEDVPLVIAQLYDHYIAHWLRGKWRHRAQWLPVAEIPARLRVARSVAWNMATGGTGRSDGVRWSDTIAYHTLAEIEHGGATLLVDRDGLLVPHGRHRSELHQQYRWIHRTVHEHLVGDYLADQVRRGNEVPDPLLMGPPQWDVPLRHMLGLLDESDVCRVFQRIRDLQNEGDPGGHIESVSQCIATALSPGSPTRVNLARALADAGRWHSAAEIDASVIDKAFVTLIENHDIRPLVVSNYVLAERLSELDGRLTQRLLNAITEARVQQKDEWEGRAEDAYQELLRWQSRRDPDGALVELIAAHTMRPADPPYLRWQGSPSPEALLDVATTVASWEPKHRLNYLNFLAGLGVDFERLVLPEGPLQPHDAHAAMALWRARRGRDAGDPSPYPLPGDVIDLILRGSYGVDAAYEMAARDDLEGRNKNATGLGPSLAHDVANLYEIEADAGPHADPIVAATALANLTLSDTRNGERLQRALGEAKICVENAAEVPIDVLLEVQWTLAALEDAPPPGYFHPAWFWPFEAIKDAIAKVFAARGLELVAAILQSDPLRWVIRPPSWADYTAVYEMSKVGALRTEDMVTLTEWAAGAGGQMLRFFAPDSMTEEFISRLYERCPDALAINDWDVAHRLAQLGRLCAWRDRLLALRRTPDGATCGDSSDHRRV